eukprot:1178634-Pleurochrysis_carterae.AAC.3
MQVPTPVAGLLELVSTPPVAVSRSGRRVGVRGRSARRPITQYPRPKQRTRRFSELALCCTLDLAGVSALIADERLLLL